MSDSRAAGTERAESLVPGQLVLERDEPVLVGASREGPAEPEPKVNLIYEAGMVVAIDVTCACGRQLRLRCEYGS